jgi:hypothetical protein
MASPLRSHVAGAIVSAQLLMACTMVARAEEPGDDLGALSQQVVQLINEARYGEAIPVAKHALAVAEQRYGQNHPEVGVALNNLAELYRLTGR